jgi:hypothetical protein
MWRRSAGAVLRARRAAADSGASRNPANMPICGEASANLGVARCPPSWNCAELGMSVFVFFAAIGICADWANRTVEGNTVMLRCSKAMPAVTGSQGRKKLWGRHCRRVFYILTIPALMFFVLGLAVFRQLYTAAEEYYYGCEKGQYEIKNDEDAVNVVKSNPIIRDFISRYPDIRASNEYLQGIGWRNGDLIGHRGGWTVRRNESGPLSRGGARVEFEYYFLSPSNSSISILCSMTRCNPFAYCKYIDG